MLPSSCLKTMLPLGMDSVRATLKSSKNYGKTSAVKGMAVAIGLALSLAMMGLEIRNGFNIGSMGCVVAVFVILLFVAGATGRLLKDTKHKFMAYLIGIITAIVLIDLFFNTGFCASPFAFGLFKWWGTGYNGGYGAGLPGDGWLDWLLLILTLVILFWLFSKL